MTGAGIVIAAALANALCFHPGDTEIVVARDAAPTVRFAAEELRRCLVRSFDAEVPVVSAFTDGRNAIVLGDNVWSRADGIDVGRLARDGFRVKTDAAGRRVYIAGRDDPKADLRGGLEKGGKLDTKFDHATLFGVYDFLERFLGARFYFPGELGTVIPRTKTLRVPETDLTSEPVFIVRHYYVNGDGEWPAECDLDYGGRTSGKMLNWLRLRMQTKRITPCHGQNSFGYLERFRETHPEYLQMRKTGKRATELPPKGASNVWKYGHWCHTSAIWDVLHDDVLARMRAGERLVDIAPHDGFQRCHCENCKRAYNDAHPESYATELIWGNVVRLANRLIADGAEGSLGMAVYPPYQRLPDFDIPTNIVFDLSVNGPWMKGQPELAAAEDRHLRGWQRKVGTKPIFWNYAGKWSGFDIKDVPQSTPRAFAEYYQAIAPIVLGGFVESDSDRALYNYLNYYVYSKIAWDGRVDVDAVLDEHYRMMFGPAAEPMRTFYESMEERWINGIAGRPDCVGMNALGPVILAPSEFELWTRIYSPALLAKWKRCFADASKAVAKGSIEARRIDFIRRVFLEPILRRAEPYVAALSVPKELAERSRTKAVNLIGNGVFADAEGWKLSAPDGEATVDPREGVTGAGALRLASADHCPTGGFIRAQGTYSLKGASRLQTGRRYRLSFFMKLKDVRAYQFGGGACVLVMHGGDDTAHTFPYLTGSSDWIHQEFTFTARPEKSDDAPEFVRARLTNASGEVWFDGFRLEEVK